MRADKDIIRYGVVGIHGYSRAHIGALLRLQDAGAPLALAAVSAYQRELDELFAQNLQKRGTTVLNTFSDLLDFSSELDIITVPTGIHLHVPMALEVLKRGIPVLLEKPVTGAIEDALTLEKAAADYGQTVYVAYQHGWMPSSWRLKEMLCAERLGALQRIVVMAAWPRNERYYERNNWAGMLKLDQTYVLDSPANNACAHYLNLPLFLAGGEVSEAAVPVAVEAELYRANEITSADTTCLRIETREGVEVVFNASHACRDQKGPLFRVECEKGIITREFGSTDDVGWHLFEDNKEIDLIIAEEPQFSLFQPLTELLMGSSCSHFYTLRQAKQQTLAVNGAFAAAPVTVIAPENIALCEQNGAVLHYLEDMNRVLEKCFEHSCLPSELRDVSWAVAKQRMAVDNLRTLKVA